jgi:hypothetical protein
VTDVFVRDRAGSVTERVSVRATGGQIGTSSFCPSRSSISSDGRFVAFENTDDNIAPGDTNGQGDVYLRDRVAGTTLRPNLSTSGAQGNLTSYHPSISADARFVVFVSSASNLVPGDTNGFDDVFIRDRAYSAMSSVCEPGASGVIACPCSNPPGVSGRGCENSAQTGGAVLFGAGLAFLTQDTLFFTTAGQVDSSTSILVQGSAPIASGIVYGQGVRCTGGTLKRLYTRNSTAGSIFAPDPALADLAVSVRSAALGDPILPGQSRWYYAYYRDPGVPVGCSPGATFNATQAGRVLWMY